MKKIIEIAEKLGWKVDVHENDINFSIYSPKGQDFNVNIDYDNELKGDDLRVDVREKLYEFYESYDPYEEASFWIGCDGHGKNGAPYHLKDLINDMEWCEEAILKLYSEIAVLY